MGIREKLNQNPKLAIILVGVIVVAMVAFLFLQLGGGGGAGGIILGNEFFTVDNGATYFSAPGTDVPPFQHEGKTAYGAAVFTCDDGKTNFVGYLIRYSDAARAIIAKDPTSNEASAAKVSGGQFKLPNTPDTPASWVDATSPAARTVTRVVCKTDPRIAPQLVHP